MCYSTNSLDIVRLSCLLSRGKVIHPGQGTKWNRAFWARGYYVVTVGNITEEAIKRYIQEQEEESKKEEMN